MANDNTGFAWHQNLILTLDGRGLRDAHLVPYVHRWVKDGTSIISGHRYCAAIGLQAGELPTRERRSQGTNLEPYCDHPAGSTWATSYKAAQGLRQLLPRPDCQQSVSDVSNSRLADLARTADPIPRNLSHPRSCDVTRRPKCGTQYYHYHGLPQHTQHCP